MPLITIHNLDTCKLPAIFDYFFYRNREQDQNTFETGITVLQIISYILQGDNTGKAREILRKYFDLNNFVSYKNGTLVQIENYQKA